MSATVVYVVVGSRGVYSDRRTWIVRCLPSKTEAEEWAAGANAYAKTAPCGRWDADGPEYAAWQAANPWDRSGARATQWDENDDATEEATYKVIAVPFGTVVAGVELRADDPTPERV